ncbi:MAG: DegT/DnrJ/EryC1/StrS family aminotransferase [Candidatus Obscuribacterales bacterium]|nr:DegT/DnrJ/EryC1/StrS family aminotransferase [Candidatus Obscuribacterales bacterium]
MDRIPVAGPWITSKEIDYVADAAEVCWYDRAWEYNARFEEAFAAYIGCKHAVTMPSCTSAIHLSLAALGVGPGAEVIVPEITWIASAAPIHYLGATTVFADVDRKTWCLSAESFERAITERTKAVVPVDLYGNMPDMDQIRAIAKKHNVHIVEDAAQAIGTEYKGKRAGGFGDAGVFSFHGSKTLTTGEGGMLCTDSDDMLARIRVLRDHGRKPGDNLFWNTEIAYKYKMTSFQAAMGLGQLERVSELLTKKREIFQWYREGLQDVEGITLNTDGENVFNTYWMVTIILDSSLGLKKEEFGKMLGEKKIDSRPFFYPLSQLPAYAHLDSAKGAEQRNPVAYELSPYGINLPSALSLTRDQVQFVCETVRSIVQSKRLAKV